MGIAQKEFMVHHRQITEVDLTAIKGAVSRNSVKLGIYKMPVKLRET